MTDSKVKHMNSKNHVTKRVTRYLIGCSLF